MGKALLVWIGICFFTLGKTCGQAPKASSWINPAQLYLKITTQQAGVYRLSGSELFRAGLPEAAPADHLQLFYRGKELAIRVEKSADGQLGPDGFIEFFSAGNTGEQDSLVYRPHHARPPGITSLYSDDCVFFLTVNPDKKGKRMPQGTYLANSLSPEPFHLEHALTTFRDEWSFNNSNGLVPYLQQSYYEAGEGWTGKLIQGDSLASWRYKLVHPVRHADFPVRLRLLVNGRFDTAHPLSFFSGKRKFASLDFSGFAHRMVETVLPAEESLTNDEINFSVQSASTAALELYSLSSYEVIYPQKTTMNGLASRYFYLTPKAGGLVKLAVEGLEKTPAMYDVTNRYEPRLLESRLIASRWETTVSEASESRKIFVTTQFLAPKDLRKIEFKEFETDYNYLILTHKVLRESAETYANYRRSAAGGGFNVLVADVQELYDPFNYGERGPLAIRNFLDFQLNARPKEAYLLLIGKGVSFPDVLKSWQDRDFVPTFGYPGSDLLLSAGLAGQAADHPTYRTGRINAGTPEEVLAYLDKVKEFESNQDRTFSKRVLHLSGGKSSYEIADLQKILSDISPLAEKAFLRGPVESIVKQSAEPVENVNIAPQINAGVGLVTFMGHASPTVPDLNIGFATSAGSQLSNAGKYPFMYFNGCGVGNVFYRYETLATDWLLAANKGAIGVLSNSYWSYAPTSARYLAALYKTLFAEEPWLGKPIGEVLQKVGDEILANNPTPYDVANVHQLILLGDPAVVLFQLDKPDFTIQSSGVFLQSSSPTQSIGKGDSVQVGLVIGNAGKAVAGQKLSVLIRLTDDAGQIWPMNHEISAPLFRDTLFFGVKNDKILTKIEVLVDDANLIDETLETNNAATLLLPWAEVADLTVYPLSALPDLLNPLLTVTVNGRMIENNSLISGNPLIQAQLWDQNPLPAEPGLIEFFLRSCDSCAFRAVESEQLRLSVGADKSLLVSYQPELAPGFYTLLVQGRDVAGNRAGQPYQVRWQVVERENLSVSVEVSPNPTSIYARFVVNQPMDVADVLLTIFSLNGQLLHKELVEVQAGIQEIFWTNSQPPGVYIYKMTVNEQVFTGRLVMR
ncbi:putative type IX secretion system sortase PorU2 [Arundinibacter roseus]|uniref:T9SS type A sorting domain-containing protein n=1 Tax=Arundinibacter roseus TaxID=2070510 RepID=A0A4R4KG33_9BACT|nr:C25 family cysteine peptidase [Arundinibacter roseus]TDB65796.1 T9SS type A sorting domain-containing protein [Arundinibacter roseus]